VSPLDFLRGGGTAIGENWIEQERVEPSRSDGRVKARSLRLIEAAEMLGLSYRQSKRIWARYRAGGAKALQHGNGGRVSNRGYGAEFRAAVLKQVQARNDPAGPGYRRRAGCWCGKTKPGNWRFTIAITVWCSANGRRLVHC
jgi:hypothetical protein